MELKKAAINIAVIAAVILLSVWGTRQYYPKQIDRTITDTVYVDKPYKVTEIKEVEKPIRVTKYETQIDTVERVRLVKDTVFIQTAEDSYQYNSQFLVGYPAAPRFLGAYKRSSSLNLTYQTTKGAVQAKSWDVGGKDYQIGLSNGEPTIRTFNSDPFKANFTAGAGYITSLKYSSPYLELGVNLQIWGVDIAGSANLNKQPFLQAGIQHEF